MRHCPRCKRKRPIEEFGRRGRDDPRPQAYCRDCRSRAQKMSRAAMQRDDNGKQQLRYLRRVGRVPEDLRDKTWHHIDRTGKTAAFRVGDEIVKVRAGKVVKRELVSR